MNLHDAKVIFRDGSLQGSCSFTASPTVLSVINRRDLKPMAFVIRENNCSPLEKYGFTRWAE